jgi:hypothetical protein
MRYRSLGKSHGGTLHRETHNPKTSTCSWVSKPSQCATSCQTRFTSARKSPFDQRRMGPVRSQRKSGKAGPSARYNRGVYVQCAVTVIVLSAGMLAQSAPPPSCPSDQPVDDFISEIHKQQSNKKHRNSNPLPDVICIWGWCRDHSSKQTPPTFPEPRPKRRILAKTRARVPASPQWTSVMTRWRWRLRPLTTWKLAITPLPQRTMAAY